MSHRKLIVLTALVVALFAFVYLFERKMPTTEERVRKGDLVWELPEDHIEAIRLDRTSGTVELARTGPTSWRLVKPDSYPADSAVVSDLLSQLARLRRAGGDTAEGKPDDYGFKSPSAKATITWKDDAKPGKKLSRTLEFGIEIPGTEATAARVAGGDSVLFVSTAVALAVRKTADELKTKEVFPPASEAARLDVERGRGRLSLAKKDGTWWLRQPLSDLAESGAVDKVIGSLTALKALEFLPAPQGQGGLASFGLAPPFIHVVLADAKGPGTSVDIGAGRSDGNSVYARRENQVFTVASTVVEDLSREAEAFREPRLLRFDRLLEQCVSPSRLVSENARRLVQLRLVAAFRRVVRDDPPEIGVDDEQRVAAGALHLDLAFQLRHTRYSSRSWVRGFAGARVRRNSPTTRRTREPANRRTSRCPTPTGAPCASSPTTFTAAAGSTAVRAPIASPRSFRVSAPM